MVSVALIRSSASHLHLTKIDYGATIALNFLERDVGEGVQREGRKSGLVPAEDSSPLPKMTP